MVPKSQRCASKVPASMQANVEPLEGNRVKLTVQLDDTEVEQAVAEAFKKIAGQVNVPGFRPGKAPRRLIEARVGAEAARAQALNDALPDHYMRALRETEIDAIAPPEINITEGEESGPVVFEAEVEIRPIPNIAGYQGLQVTLPSPEPSDDDVVAQIERLRVQQGELEPVDRAAQTGDFVTLDINGTHEGEPVPGLTATDWSYEVGSGLASLGAEFDEQVAGSSVEDVLEFTSPVPPNDEEVTFRVVVKAIAERRLPDLDDEFANEVSEFDTLDELRADVAGNLRQVRVSETMRAYRGRAIEALADLVDDAPPETLIDAEMQRSLREIAYRLEQQGANLAQFLEATGQAQADFVEQLRENATATVRADLALRALADAEGIEATEEEIDAEVEELARQFGQKASRVRRDLERADHIPGVRSDIRKAKAVDWLVQHVEAVDDEGRTIDRSLLTPPERDDEGAPADSVGEEDDEVRATAGGEGSA